MKTILLILALTGFTAFGSYAQNSKNCACKKKTTTHKVVSTHHRKTTQVKIVAASPEEPAKCVPVAATPEPCYMYRKDNIVVMECPGIFYSNDDKGVFEYGADGAYLGYYPLSAGSGSDNSGKCVNNAENDGSDLVAPQHTTIDHYKGAAPAGGNYCTKCTPQ